MVISFLAVSQDMLTHFEQMSCRLFCKTLYLDPGASSFSAACLWGWERLGSSILTSRTRTQRCLCLACAQTRCCCCSHSGLGRYLYFRTSKESTFVPADDTVAVLNGASESLLNQWFSTATCFSLSLPALDAPAARLAFAASCSMLTGDASANPNADAAAAATAPAADELLVFPNPNTGAASSASLRLSLGVSDSVFGS